MCFIARETEDLSCVHVLVNQVSERGFTGTSGKTGKTGLKTGDYDDENVINIGSINFTAALGSLLFYGGCL